MATSNMIVNRAGVSRTLSTRFAVGDDLDSFAQGLVEVYMPKTVADYWTYRRFMHDILCLALLDLGVYREEHLTLEKFKIQTNDKQLNTQCPDLYAADMTTLSVGDVLMSYNIGPETRHKQKKYERMFSLIHDETGLDVNFSVISVDLTDTEWEDGLPKLSELFMVMLRSFVDNLRYIHANSKFSSYRSTTADHFHLDKFRFELSKKDIPDFMSNLSGCKMNLDEVLARLEGRVGTELSTEEYVTEISAGILSGPYHKRPIPHPEPDRCDDLKKEWGEYISRPKTTDKLPRVLQLGAPLEMTEIEITFEEVVSELKSTPRHGGYLDMIKTSLQSNPPDDGHTIHLSMSDSQLLKEQMEGPGRKAAMKRAGMKTKRKEPKHIGVSTLHEVLLHNFVQQIETSCLTLSHQEMRMPDIETTGMSMFSVLDSIVTNHNNCPMSGITKFYQRISQEIVINSMRRRKNRQYVLCGTGFRHIYLLVGPGPQLRTESNTEFVKIISLVRPLVNELSAPWEPVGDHWESGWLSVDTDRLKHWARAYDRTLIASVACAERLVEPGKDLRKACLEEIKLGNYHLMCLFYLEDKQLTSLTNQSIRYLWMKSLGDKQFKGILSKFPSRVGSVIQSSMLQSAIRTTLFVAGRPLSDFVKVPRANRDEQTGSYDETTTGVIGKLPRLFTNGEHVPLSYNLNEIYWCMMYNKDRQNPAQDALSILSKVLKEEEKFTKEITSRTSPKEKADYVFGNTSVAEDLNHVWSENPESHYFSRRAVLAGMELQSKHVDNMAPDNGWITMDKIDKILSKNLSEFATFKASVKTICTKVDPTDLKDIENVGKRTKAVELVSELVTDEKLMTAMDVAMSFSGDGNEMFDVLIQIFKKGQIGGIREIMILYIKARILFNIVEEICRLLSKSDKREILTKGKDKRLMMRGDYEEVLSQFPKGAPVQMVKNSYDMATWCQKFIPTIFCSIYTKAFEDLPSVRNLAYYIFLKHTNKKIEYPKKLVEQWSKNPKIKHKESWLQNAKQKFLDTGIPFFDNRSNMCQGIPHYNSTVLALSCQSLRDALFEECVSQLGQEVKIRWKTRVGSDDKGDMIGIDMSTDEGFPQYLLFEQCAHTAERLHSMELSVKSAAGNIMYELNSAFMANLETLSPTVKFALASCDMVSTSSCSVFVNEAYGRVRQLRENGASSALCGLAQILNSSHFETIFRTGPGMTNDVTKTLGLPRNLIPYDLGVYPFYDIDLQEVVGPEFHNYLCMTSDEVPMSVKRLLYTPMNKSEIDEAFPSEDEGLLKKDHFGIRQGLIKQLVAMRRRLGIEASTVEEFFSKNPFLLVRGPETLEETRNVIYSKLLTKGASEALRRTSPAIYLGRLSAFESAKAWRIRSSTGQTAVDIEEGVVEELEEDVPATYLEFMKWALSRADKASFPVMEMMGVIFPQRSSYEVIRQFIGQFGARRENSKKYSQAVRTWVVNSYNYNFSNSLKSILETSFGLSQLSSKEDIGEFKKMIGFNLDSYEGFISECAEKGLRPMDLFFYMSKIYKASKVARIQAFANGPSSGSLHTTLISLKRFSHLPNTEMVLDLGIDPSEVEREDKADFRIESMKFCCNLLLMEDQESLSGAASVLDCVDFKNQTMRSWCETTIRSIRSTAGFDHHTKKILTYVATKVLQMSELKEKLVAWKSLNYTYLKKQRRTVDRNGNVSWTGDLEMLINAGNNTFTLHVQSGNHFLRASRIDDHEALLSSLYEICRILEFEPRSFFTKRPIRQNDFYLSVNSKRLIFCESNGPEENCLNLHLTRAFRHMRLQDYDNFRVNLMHNDKSGAITVNLVQREQRSATICHFPGSYYPTSSPPGLVVDDRLWFKGIRLSRLLDNSDWFYNYRLPSLSEEDSTMFFRRDVNFEQVLRQTTQEKGKIVEYLQVMEEINEEAFSITNTMIPFGGTAVSVLDVDKLEGMNVNDLFKQAMEGIANEGVFAFQPIEASQSWAEEMEEEEEKFAREGERRQEERDRLENIDDMFEVLGGEEDGIKYIRSLGFKKKARKANFMVISQMQQGHLIKERVLNTFFKNGSITSEDRRRLPNYYVWFRDNSHELPEGLSTELARVVLSELALVMGARENELSEYLSKANPRLGVAPTRVTNFLYGGNQDLFSSLSQGLQFSQSLYEEESVESETGF